MPDPGSRAWSDQPVRCPKCGADDPSMLEVIERGEDEQRWFCNVCAYDWNRSGVTGGDRAAPAVSGPRRAEPEAAGDEERTIRFRSLDHLIAHAALRRDELVTLAQIGALNGFGYDRRSALWQIERAIRPAGEMFEERPTDFEPPATGHEAWNIPITSTDALTDATKGEPLDPAKPLPVDPESSMVEGTPRLRMSASESTSDAGGRKPDTEAGAASPLRPMTDVERVIADYDGTGLTIGPHPMALRRNELALRGILRAIDLPHARQGRRVRVAGAVITRQRPGTAKGFVFLTLEDETGISNVIVQPNVFTEQRVAIVREPFVIVEGILQQEDGVTAVRAERVLPLVGSGPSIDSHDFH